MTTAHPTWTQAKIALQTGLPKAAVNECLKEQDKKVDPDGLRLAVRGLITPAGKKEVLSLAEQNLRPFQIKNKLAKHLVTYWQIDHVIKKSTPDRIPAKVKHENRMAEIEALVADNWSSKDIRKKVGLAKSTVNIAIRSIKTERESQWASLPRVDNWIDAESNTWNQGDRFLMPMNGQMTEFLVIDKCGVGDAGPATVRALGWPGSAQQMSSTPQQNQSSRWPDDGLLRIPP